MGFVYRQQIAFAASTPLSHQNEFEHLLDKVLSPLGDIAFSGETEAVVFIQFACRVEPLKTPQIGSGIISVFAEADCPSE
jgi:hypothetical protein